MKNVSFTKQICMCAALLSVIFMLVLGCETPAPKTTTVPATTPAASGPKTGGILKVAMNADGISIGYPPKLSKIHSNLIAAPAIETLLRLDKTGKPIPWLASAFKEDAVNKSVTLTLNQGIKFHDGTDFNAEAVKWNLDQCRSVKLAGTERFSSIDIVDNNTIRISLTAWDNSLTMNLASTLGMMVSPTAFKKNGEDWSASNPVGTGPFQLVSWQKEIKVTYKKFAGYWQKNKPYLDGIEFTPIVDGVTRLMSFTAKDFDTAINMNPKDTVSLESGGFIVTRSSSVSTGAYTLVPDSKNQDSPFSKLQVRQATQHAIDTAALVKAIFYNEAVPVNQWCDKSSWAYNPSVVGYPYDVTKAKLLLADAGYPNGFKTTIHYAMMTPTDDLLYAGVQGYLKAVGIDATLDPMQGNLFNQKAFMGGTWDGLMWGPVSSTIDFVAALNRYYGGTPGFYSQTLIPDEFVKNIQSALATSDFATKQKLAQDTMKLMVDKYCMQLFLYNALQNSVSQKTVRDSNFYTIMGGTWTPENAWLDK